MSALKRSLKFLDEPELIGQQTIGDQDGDRIDILTYEVDAVSESRAGRKAVRKARSNESVSDILSPKVSMSSDTEQTSLTQYLPDALQYKRFTIEVVARF